MNSIDYDKCLDIYNSIQFASLYDKDILNLSQVRRRLSGLCRECGLFILREGGGPMATRPRRHLARAAPK